jgi:cytochrome P450
MNERRKPDWDPRSEDVLEDQISAYDEMREHCPVAFSELMQWSVFRYEDVLSIIKDPERFGNGVSQHLNVPAGMDPPEHTAYRLIIDKYFRQERMDAFEPTCREIVINIISNTLEDSELELMADFARPFAVNTQCAFLGWPQNLQKTLADWTDRNYVATLAQDRQTMSDIAREFEAIVDEMCETRLKPIAKQEDDVTTSLLHEKVWGRELSNEEIASILRTWTVGEIGSIASSVGILVHYLAEHNELQEKLRSDPSLLPPAIDEILRIHGPLVASRRITKCPVEINGKKIDAGERISLNWISANRDENVFEKPDNFRLDRDSSMNLLYGAGIHVCPGAPLARMEMRVVLEELLMHTIRIQLDSRKLPIKARYPASGFAFLPVRIY